MAQRHHDLTDTAAGPAALPVTGEALAAYLRAQATEFLRALRLHRETGGGTPNGSAHGAVESVDAARALRRSARRISGSLHTFRPLLDPDWSEEIRPELAWLSGTLALEHACEARLERLLLALHRLSGATAVPPQTAGAGGATGKNAGTTTAARGGSAAGGTSASTATGASAGAGAGPSAHTGASAAAATLDGAATGTGSNTPTSTHTDAPANTGASTAAATLDGAATGTGSNTPTSTHTDAPANTGADTAPDGHTGSAPGAGNGHATDPRADASAGAGADTAAVMRADSTNGMDSSTSASPGTGASAGAGGGTAAGAGSGHSASPDGANAPAGAGAAAGGRTGSATRPRTSAAASTSPAARTSASVAAGGRATGAASVPKKAAPGHAGGPARPATPDRGNLTVGAAKAGALLDRQLTLARTRAHSTALQALGSSRFHAVADKVAVLASEVPLTPTATTTDLRPLAAAAEERLTDAVAALPLVTAGHPYNAEALVHGLSPDPSPHPQDAPWHQVRLLLRLHRYALEVLYGGDAPLDVRLISAGQALDRHRDASEAAAAAAQAARTPRIAPATAYALGVLHADQRHEVEAARYAFQRSWLKQTVGTGTP
ncbi:CHAD domain-containing protein OS=Streptomyces aurantiogriseus OX=66870 GN=GCM10010251_71460 PE=4 SV=1 [Streptomyces aurantiogriseus]|uniref:CHAD domain-containing protein n=2 Tax=Streptomyces aurantiogriseus TaxID=66870 RepID=A0A918FK12_9ACTN|nr:hypothetical protein GCM10010251_71460 [Streptomyces aurantiogriseus]